MASKKSSLKKTGKNRLKIVYFGLAVIFGLLTIRLLYVMGFQAEKLKAVGSTQWTRSLKISAKRGNILDRNGHELAISADVYRVDFDLTTLRETLKKKKTSPEDFSDKLASILDMKATEILKAYNTTLKNGLPASWAPVKRQIEKSQADKVKELNIFGILVSSDTKRYYPNNNFLSHVIGHINDEGNGISGVEQKYNEQLSGKEGELTFESDSRNTELMYEDSRYTKPVDGNSLILTIDDVIQGFAEKAAEKAFIDNKAKTVSITVMNPKNGEVLAMVNKPDYNLNSPSTEGKSIEELQSTWKNNAVQNSFEPGSIFKAITAAAALQYGTHNENSKFYCSGHLVVAGETIYCWEKKGHGAENFVDILKNSCNVGFMEIGRELGADRLVEFALKMGFGKSTGIDLPGESSGIVRDKKSIGPVELATMSFGQSIATTQVQYMAAFNAIANGGTWITPHVMKSLGSYDDNGKLVVTQNNDKIEKKQILDANLTTKLRGYLEQVVSKGAAHNAYIEEYKIGGKTGTAQKYENGKLADKKYISTFAGLAPYDDPKITLIVTVDEPDPSKYYAGQVSAPVAKELFNDIFNYISLNKDVLK